MSGLPQEQTSSGHHGMSEKGEQRKWPAYSITSSARCCRRAGTSRPSAFAVLRLMSNSNLTGGRAKSQLLPRHGDRQGDPGCPHL